VIGAWDKAPKSTNLILRWGIQSNVTSRRQHYKKRKKKGKNYGGGKGGGGMRHSPKKLHTIVKGEVKMKN